MTESARVCQPGVRTRWVSCAHALDTTATSISMWSTVQVMAHPWCQKMDYDISYENAETGELFSFPCWTLCISQNDDAVRLARTAYDRVKAEWLAEGHAEADWKPDEVRILSKMIVSLTISHDS